MRLLKIFLWTLVAVWAGFIFYMSAQTAVESSNLSSSIIWQLADSFYAEFDDMTYEEKEEFVSSLQAVVRTIGHIGEYAILGIFMRLALVPYSKKKKVLIAFLPSSLYAVSDEIHQIFVEGRTFQFSDIICDSIGAFLGILFITLICIICRKRKIKKSKKDLQL